MTTSIVLTTGLLFFFIFLVWMAEDTQRYQERKKSFGLPIIPRASRERIALESPFRPIGDSDEQVAFSALMNRLYLRLALYHSLSQGEAPFASHAIYTQALDDANADERAWGIQAGFDWYDCTTKVVAYEDLGLTAGMIQGMLYAESEDMPVERRKILTEESHLMAFYELVASIADEPSQQEPTGKQVFDFIQAYSSRFRDYTKEVEDAILHGIDMAEWIEAAKKYNMNNDVERLHDAFHAIKEEKESPSC